MVVERTIGQGFHSNLSAFKGNRRSKISTKSAIKSGLPFNPTYESVPISKLEDSFPIFPPFQPFRSTAPGTPCEYRNAPP